MIRPRFIRGSGPAQRRKGVEAGSEADRGEVKSLLRPGEPGWEGYGTSAGSMD